MAVGRVTVEPLRPYDLTGLSGMTAARHVWRPPARLVARPPTRVVGPPPARLVEHLPTGFELALDAVAGPDGVRQFVPTNLEKFLRGAAVGGLALLTDNDPLPGEELFSYRVMRLLRQTSRQFGEHLDRQFERMSDLYVSCDGSAVADGRSVLPPGLGLDERGRGEPWSVRNLIERGRAAGGGATAGECIRRGLIEAARLNPLDPAQLTKAGCATIVRMALFNFGPCEDVSEEVSAVVQDRLFEAMERSDLRCEGPKYWRWLFGDLTNLVHGIAKRKGGDVRVSRDQVRQVLLNLAFASHTYVGDCVYLQMCEFAAALPEPLTHAERVFFKGMYSRQGHLGGLPLVVLQDRFGWLKEAVAGAWASPTDPAGAGVVLRMLEYYGSMVRCKRGSDAAVKARGHALGGRPATVQGLRDEDGASEQAPDRFHEIVAELRRRRGVPCGCRTAGRWSAGLADWDPAAESIEILYECAACGCRGTLGVTRAEFRAAGGDPG